nr:hypothetical protein [Pseudomonas syringae]
MNRFNEEILPYMVKQSSFILPLRVKLTEQRSAPMFFPNDLKTSPELAHVHTMFCPCFASLAETPPTRCSRNASISAGERMEVPSRSSSKCRGSTLPAINPESVSTINNQPFANWFYFTLYGKARNDYKATSNARRIIAGSTVKSGSLWSRIELSRAKGYCSVVG